MENNKVRMETKRIIIPHVYLFNAARSAIEQAEKSDDEHQFYNCMSCILFSALCIEAYLNHIGRRAFRLWEDDLQSLSPLAKLRLIAQERTGALPDFSRRPFQSFTEIFKFRNLLAHGKTERLKKESVQETADSPEQPIGKWEQYCTMETAKKLFDDTEKMIRSIQAHSPEDKDPFAMFGASVTNVIEETDSNNTPPLPDPEGFI